MSLRGEVLVEYTRLNPYLRPYGENGGNTKNGLDNFVRSGW